MAKIGLNTKEGSARSSKKEFVQAKANAALTQINNDIDDIEADELLLPAATNTQLKEILGNVLARQKRELRRERAVIRYLAAQV